MIQSRYHWDDNTIENLSFLRFQQLLKLLPKLRQEEIKERFILSAFVGFQMGAGGDKTFGDYLRRLGLLEEKLDIKENITKEQALAKVQDILKRRKK